MTVDALYFELLGMLVVTFMFGQVTLAISAVMAFYVLARAISAFRLIAESPLLPQDSFAQEVIGWFMEALAFVLPSLDRFTRSEWLMYGEAGWADLGPVLAQSAIYLALLASAALFDLYRRNL